MKTSPALRNWLGVLAWAVVATLAYAGVVWAAITIAGPVR